LFRPIFSIAGTTIGEAIRRKVLLVILLIGAFLLILAPSLGILSARSETTVLKGMMLGVIQLTSAVIAIVLTVYMIPNEIERRTIYTILSKPVQRWQFLVGKYLGAVGALGLMMALMGLLMVLMFRFEMGMTSVSDLSDLLKAPLMYFVQMSILASVAVAFSTFVTPLVNFFLSGSIYLIGSLFNPFFETIQSSPNTPAVAKGFATLVNAILPNFANYNVQNPIINPGQEIHNEGSYYMMATVYGVFYILIALIVGILVFDRREV
jgi:ABC-type transport system involved in multi-copper enzyme maturation permease subunit